MATSTPPVDRDEQRLAEMGYKQELNRSWSGFQNFAISFTIISVLAGCFTTYYQGWNNGGPVAIFVGLADHLGLHPHHLVLHGRARLGVPDGRRHLLVVGEARRPGLGLVHRLVQPARADRDPRLGRLLRRAVPPHRPRPLQRHHLRHQLRRHKPAARPDPDLPALRDPADVARDPQHPRQPSRRPAQRRVGLLARGRASP